MHDSVKKLADELSIPTTARPSQDNAAGNNLSSDAVPIEKEKPEKENIIEEVSDDIVENGADLSIGLFDIAQSTIFRWLVKKRKNKKLISLYGDEALNKMQHLLNEQDAAENNKLSQTIIREFTPDELGMLKIAKDVDELLEDLPMTETEKDLIKIPLMQIMKKRGGSLPPEYALILGLMQVTGSRVGEMYMI